MSGLFQSIAKKLQVKQNERTIRQDEGPMPLPENCKWGVIDFFSVLPWPAFTVTKWAAGSMLLALGLTVPQAIGAATVAHCLQTMLCIAVGHSGVTWRLSNPLGSRLSWGVRGYACTVAVSIAVTTCYSGIHLVFGYLVVICALIPSFATMYNSFNESIPTNDFICMLLFIGFSSIAHYLPVNTWRIVGPYAAMVTFIAFIAIVSVCCSQANGVGPLLNEPFTYSGLEQKPSSSQVIWAFFLSISSLLSSHSPLNEANYTRFSRNFQVPMPAQIIGHAMLPVLITTFGIIATSAAVKVFPNEEKLLWAPYEVLLAFQRLENAGPGIRAATFFGGLVMVFPQLGMNVFWNGYSNGLRLTLLFPRWFTVKRGGLLTLALSVAINPWLFATRPTGFNLFLNGTAMIYGCLTGLFLSDYFIVRRTCVKVADLLLLDKRSTYWYTNGTNWRAAGAVLATVWLVIPGWIMILINNSRVLNDPWEKIYGLSWMLTFFVSGSFYYVISKIWPMEGTRETDAIGTESEETIASKQDLHATDSQSEEKKAALSPI